MPYSEEEKKRIIMNIGKGSEKWQKRKAAAEMKEGGDHERKSQGEQK